ncbi:uncharacterized protein LOC111716823 isoform X2 [Eurytemora carolleeae]|uniref:uncharacterized protein LOC111716823 isoform X2 n=1 Tax=Eurytemora carolleeae TaxID=1294199 RepID=UPI000C782098|nr:uncharacterized protein LOC111716823 isoform X2 [Eurytemora carolleeae]|eukprot:XP_023348086.1 uncharacterized protein LOC111716823 isoform X2 [Eurytemora affinis]
MISLILVGMLPALCLGQAHFFGPVAVGFGAGLLGLQRHFPVATSIASRRSSRQYSLSTFYQSTPYGSFGYSTRSYTLTDHFYTPNNLAYYQPNIYHYHSTPWGARLHPYRKKRAAENAIARRKRREATPIDIDSVEVSKIGDVASNVTAGFNDKIWYSDMSFKDRDDCSKRLLCELNAKYAEGQPMEEDEITIALSFGNGDEVDIGEETMDFDIAAVVGKQMGVDICVRRYRRCETSVPRILEMIRMELRELETVEAEVKSGNASLEDLENALADEEEEVKNIKESDIFATTTTTTTSTTVVPGVLPLLFG